MLLVFAAALFALFLSIRLALLLPVVVLENQGVKEAFSRAWRLNQGNWWRTFGVTALVSLLGSFTSQLVTTPISLLTSGPAFSTFPQAGQTWSIADLPSFGSFWLYLVGTLVASYASTVLLLPLVPLTNGLLYIDRRIRRESLDMQLAAEAGVNLSAPPPPPHPGYGGWPGQQPPYGQPPYQAPYGQPAYGQSPYGNWPGQQQPPAGGWPPAQPPAPPAAPPQDSTPKDATPPA